MVVGLGGAKPPRSGGDESGRWGTSGKRLAVGPAMVWGVEVPGGGDGGVQTLWCRKGRWTWTHVRCDMAVSRSARSSPVRHEVPGTWTPVLRGEGGERSQESMKVWGLLRAGPWKWMGAGDRSVWQREGTAWRAVGPVGARACTPQAQGQAGWGAPGSCGPPCPAPPLLFRRPPASLWPCRAAPPSSSAQGPSDLGAASRAHPGPDPGALQHRQRDTVSFPGRPLPAPGLGGSRGGRAQAARRSAGPAGCRSGSPV